MGQFSRAGAAALVSISLLSACGSGDGAAAAPAPQLAPTSASLPPDAAGALDPVFTVPAPAAPATPTEGVCTYPAAVQADFGARDQLPQFIPDSNKSSWGPWPAAYAAPAIPANCEPREWQRERVVAVAKKYIGLAYRHHHVPGYDGGDGTGLDCSNFTAWVYNYGLGVRMSSAIGKQADTAGRRLGAGEQLQAGDLLYITTLDRSEIAHVVMYLDPLHVIDSTGPGVQVREFKGWYAARFSHARRIIE